LPTLCRNRKAENKAIGSAGIDPFFDLVGDLFRRALEFATLCRLFQRHLAK